MMSPMSAEATVLRNYLDWLLSIPLRRAGPGDLIMSETKQTTAATTGNRDRRSELIRFVKRRRLPLAIFTLPPIALAGWAAA